MAHDLVEHRLLTGMGMLVGERRQDAHVGLEVLMGPPVDKLGVRSLDLETESVKDSETLFGIN